MERWGYPHPIPNPTLDPNQVRGHSGFSLEQHRVNVGKPSLLAT